MINIQFVAWLSQQVLLCMEYKNGNCCLHYVLDYFDDGGYDCVIETRVLCWKAYYNIFLVFSKYIYSVISCSGFLWIE